MNSVGVLYQKLQHVAKIKIPTLVHMGCPEAFIAYPNGLISVGASLTLLSEEGTDLCPRNVIFHFYFKHIKTDNFKCDISPYIAIHRHISPYIAIKTVHK